MYDYYKGHHIRSTARPLFENGRCRPHVVINWTNDSGEQSREFDIELGFGKEVDAETEGMTFAKEWINDGKPRVR